MLEENYYTYNLIRVPLNNWISFKLITVQTCASLTNSFSKFSDSGITVASTDEFTKLEDDLCAFSFYLKYCKHKINKLKLLK